MRAVACLPIARNRLVAPETPVSVSRAREAGRAWLDFWHEHTYEHPNGRCPVLRLYASYETWAEANGRAVVSLDDVVEWTADLNYRLVGRPRDGQVGATTYWQGIVGRAYDPEGWPEAWAWPDALDRNPASWYVARSDLRASWTSRGCRDVAL